MSKALTFILALASIVALCLVALQPSPITVPLVSAQSQNVETSAYVSVESNVAVAGQDIRINMLISPHPPTPTDVFYGAIILNITRPDGSRELKGPFRPSPDGSVYCVYRPIIPGDYQLQISYDGESFANNTIVYQPTLSQKVILTVLAPSSPSPLTTYGPSSIAATGFWSSKAPMHEARNRPGVAVVGGKIYVIGGDNLYLSGNCLTAESSFGSLLDVNEMYDPATSNWITKAPMPTPRTNFGIAVHQGKIYCIGGLAKNSSGYFCTTNITEVYDPATDTWETKTAMPTPRHNLQANIVNGKIYLIGGYLGQHTYTMSNINEVYEPSTDTWIKQTPMPHSVCGSASVAVDSKIYFLGGWSGKAVQIYETKTNSWSFGAPAPRYALSSTASAITSIDGSKYIYLFDEASTQIYDPANDTWFNTTAMPTSRGYARVAVVDDMFYVIGGILAPFEGYIVITNSVAANEQYTPSNHNTSDPASLTPLPSLITSPFPLSSPSLNPSPFPSLSSSSASSPTLQPTSPKFPKSENNAYNSNLLNESYWLAIIVVAASALTAIIMLLIKKTRRKQLR